MLSTQGKMGKREKAKKSKCLKVEAKFLCTTIIEGFLGGHNKTLKRERE